MKNNYNETIKKQTIETNILRSLKTLVSDEKKNYYETIKKNFCKQ